jgi:23S rRNA pseudouridine1911/1915/1917 synthase
LAKNQISILYQDKNFLALYKPAGILVHGIQPKAGNLKPKTEITLVDWLIKKFPEIKNVGDAPEIRPGIVHRLDKDTSGVILIARNQKYFEYLKKLFQTGQIKKTYLALVYGKVEPKTGVIEKPIFLKPGTTKRTVHGGKMEKPAITEYKVIKYFSFPRQFASESLPAGRQARESATFSLLKVMPKTGRTHQIRIHLSSIGHPIVGDALYGPKRSPFGKSSVGRQFLHAESLEFSQENSKRIKIETGLPDDLKDFLENLRLYHTR